jgi:hypothetical protein
VGQLRIGLVHLNVRNQPEINREEMVSFNRQVAEAGAKLLLLSSQFQAIAIDHATTSRSSRNN